MYEIIVFRNATDNLFEVTHQLQLTFQMKYVIENKEKILYTYW